MNAGEAIRGLIGTLGISEPPAGLILGPRQVIAQTVNLVVGAGLVAQLLADQPLVPAFLGADDALLIETLGGGLTTTDATGLSLLQGVSAGIGNPAALPSFMFPSFASSTVILANAQTSFYVQPSGAVRTKDMGLINPAQALHLFVSAIVKNGAGAGATFTLKVSGYYRVISGVQP